MLGGWGRTCTIITECKNVLASSEHHQPVYFSILILAAASECSHKQGMEVMSSPCLQHLECRGILPLYMTAPFTYHG